MELLERCPFCGEENNIRRHGHYFVKSPTERGQVKEQKVDRFFCKSCNRLFGSHTQLSRAWTVGLLKEPKRLSSEYRKNKKELILKKIDKYIRQKGIGKVQELCSEIGISHSTYYDYLKELKSRFRSEMPSVRQASKFENLGFVEWKLKVPFHYKEDTRPENIRFFLLVDLDVELIIDYFFIEKKNQKISYHGRATTLYGHRFTISDLVKYMEEMAEKYPSISITVQSSEYISKKLIAIDPQVFSWSSKRITNQLKRKMDKYRFSDSPKFVWAIYGPYSKRDSSNRYKSKRHLKDTIETLIAIYNSKRLTDLAK